MRQNVIKTLTFIRYRHGKRAGPFRKPKDTNYSASPFRSAKKFDFNETVSQVTKAINTEPINTDQTNTIRSQISSIIDNSIKRKSEYIDLENRSLDLTLPNKELCEIIIRKHDSRMQKRFKDVSDIWQQQFTEDVKKIPEYNGDTKKAQEAFGGFFKNGSISISKIVQPLSIGDLVTVHGEGTEFFLVTDTPKDLDSKNYTFVNSNGRIVFSHSGIIKFRIPSVVPLSFVPIVKSFVMEEPKTGFAPIGENTQKTINSENPGEVDFLDSESSKSVVNPDLKTFVVPEPARNLYSKHLVRLSIDSMNYYKLYCEKLELLHRILQFNNQGAITKPRIVSIFTILHAIDTVKMPAITNFNNADLERLSQLVNNQQNPNEVETKEYPIAKYFAVLLAIRKQNRLWKINEQNSRNPVTSIIVLPITNKITKDNLATYLKEHSQEMVEYMVAKARGAKCKDIDLKYYEATIQLMKDFVIGNIRDYSLESMVSSLIRQIDNSLNLPDTYAYDYGRSKCYDILQVLKEVDYDDPVIWATGLEYETSKDSLKYFEYLNRLVSDSTSSTTSTGSEISTGSETKTKKTKKQDLRLKPPVIFDSFEKKFSKFQFPITEFSDDPMQSQRTDFHHPIFCIDAPDAHEIDDGISIHPSKDGYTIGIHIANPSSYIKYDSNVSSLAFNKGLTTYLPEGPIKMLPDFISEKFGLIDEARTFTIEFDIPSEFEQLTESKLYSVINCNKRIKFYNAKNLPKGYTYDYVSEVLDGKPDAHSESLKVLNKLAEKLKVNRINNGAQDLNYSRVAVKVDKNSELPEGLTSDSKGHQLTFNGITINLRIEEAPKSQLLVSELMIISNHLTSTLAQELQIPIIHRNQVMNLSPTIADQIKHAKNNYDDMMKVFRFMNSAKLSTENLGHESLGLTGYSQITSPLRRYSDMVNQWNIQAYYSGETTQSLGESDPRTPHTSPRSNPQYIQLSPIINHLQTKELINKQLAKVSERFWLGMFLKHYSKYDDIKFKVLVRELFNGKYSADLVGFDFRAHLEEEGLTENEMIEGGLRFNTVDFMENELSFKRA